MAKPKRGQVKEGAAGLLGTESVKAPKPPPTHEEQQAKEKDWGLPTSTRLSPSEKDVIEKLARHHDTTLSEIMRLLIRLGIDDLAQGRYRPQFQKVDQKRKLDETALPKLPAAR